ncbi:hypothetical protein LCM20_09905 [Halobacillus litoralis]|uniref:hypothetical protein n=1 Tax=Halobacillus litoralis TaxID=45668 RepID=UPI001CD46775|nr:hypothetical protein [Halobacillus litoralis]MCA0970904.1 hypothetical protein [Halobacillus litoralis]
MGSILGTLFRKAGAVFPTVLATSLLFVPVFLYLSATWMEGVMYFSFLLWGVFIVVMTYGLPASILSEWSTMKCRHRKKIALAFHVMLGAAFIPLNIVLGDAYLPFGVVSGHQPLDAVSWGIGVVAVVASLLFWFFDEGLRCLAKRNHWKVYL